MQQYKFHVIYLVAVSLLAVFTSIGESSITTVFIHKLAAYYLLGASFVFALYFSKQLPKFNPITKPRAVIGLIVICCTGLVPTLLTTIAGHNGLVSLYSKSQGQWYYFSAVDQPVQFWIVFVLYIAVSTLSLSFALKYYRHAIRAFRVAT